MAEVHLIGEIVGAEGFPSQNLFCKWGLSVGSAWEVLEGLQEGQTQVDHPQVSIWIYRSPLFIGFVLRTESSRNGHTQLVSHSLCAGLVNCSFFLYRYPPCLQRASRLAKIVFSSMARGLLWKTRTMYVLTCGFLLYVHVFLLNLDGYGFIHVPTVPGMHQLRCSTWKPSGSFKDQFTCKCLYATHEDSS